MRDTRSEIKARGLTKIVCPEARRGIVVGLDRHTQTLMSTEKKMDEEKKTQQSFPETPTEARINDTRRLAEMIARREHEGRIASLTLAQLRALPAETTVYRSVGRAYLKTNKETVESRLENVSTTTAQEASQLRDKLKSAA